LKDTPIIKASDARAEMLLDGVAICRVKKGGKYPVDKQTGEKYKYLNIVTSFDIETSKAHLGKEVSDWQSWMYIWQWQFGERYTVIGRTWAEFLVLVQSLNEYLQPMGARLLVYVHNLAFEFQFLSGIWPFDEFDVFATDKRSPLYCKMQNLELRCSYRLSGYALDDWCKNLRTDHQKLVGELDYSVMRFSDTPLTDEELAYCVHDVICVVECVESVLTYYDDNLYTIPYTVTGYIRRKVREALRCWCPDGVTQMQNSIRTYDRLRNAFRGGDTHANRSWVGDLLGDVHSYDRSSSYPDVMVHCKFPMSKFRDEEPTLERLQYCLDHGRCLLMKWKFGHIRLRNPRIGNPYIPFDKCTEVGYCYPLNADVENGRVLSADYLEIAITDIDFEIIQDQYQWEYAKIDWMESARYGYLPRPLTDVIISLYQAKTALKGVEGAEVRYNHAKGEINSCYGMMCQRVITNPIEYKNGKWQVAEDFNREEEYKKAIEKAYLNYAWAPWVTAHARYRLWEGIKLAEAKHGDRPISAFVYADTDSVKARGEVDFSKFNAERIRDAKRSGAWALDSKGNPHYMGVYEDEGSYDLFRTLGAKRYCFVKNGKLKITVAGVPKEKGSEELEKLGGIEKFDFNLIFHESEKLGAVYHDPDEEPLETVIDGHPVRITANVTLVETEYSMNPGRGYLYQLQLVNAFLDKHKYTDYNMKW